MKTFLIALAVIFGLANYADARPPQAPPVDQRLDAIEQDLTTLTAEMFELKARLQTLETKGKCPCPDGKCICGPYCECPDCPEHKKFASGDCEFKGRKNSKGRHVKVISSKDCAPCLRLLKALCEAGLCDNIELVKFDSLQEAADKGYESLPHAHLCENGDTKVRVDYSACSAERFKEWLAGSVTKSRAVSRSSRAVQYSAPRYSSPCGPGGCGPRYSSPCGPGGCGPRFSSPGPQFSSPCGPGGCGPRFSAPAFRPSFSPMRFGGCAGGNCR